MEQSKAYINKEEGGENEVTELVTRWMNGF